MQMITDPNNTNNSTYAQSGAIVFSFPATAAIADKALVALTCDDTGTISVTEADTDVHDPAVKVGVALEAASAAGDMVRTVVYGPAIVKTPATGPSVSEKLILTSDAGVGDGLAADATSVAGDIHGTFLTDEIGTTNTCWVWVGE